MHKIQKIIRRGGAAVVVLETCTGIEERRFPSSMSDDEIALVLAPSKPAKRNVRPKSRREKNA